MVNADLLEKTLLHIFDNPDEWLQSSWRCESGMCFAGWAATLAGGQWLLTPDQVVQWEHTRLLELEHDPAFPRDRYNKVANPEQLAADPEQGWAEEEARERAIRVLGLLQWQANLLFDETNTLDTLKKMVDALLDDENADLQAIADKAWE